MWRLMLYDSFQISCKLFNILQNPLTIFWKTCLYLSVREHTNRSWTSVVFVHRLLLTQTCIKHSNVCILARVCVYMCECVQSSDVKAGIILAYIAQSSTFAIQWTSHSGCQITDYVSLTIFTSRVTITSFHFRFVSSICRATNTRYKPEMEGY